MLSFVSITNGCDILSRQRYLFIWCWLLGLLLGMISAFPAGTFLFSLMRCSDIGTVSIVLWSIACLPFFITAYAVLLHKLHIVYPVVFITAFFFSLLGQTLRLGFGSAGWLLQPMAQVFYLAVMAMYCFFCLSVSEKNAVRSCCICVLFCAAAALADRNFVTPYILMLFDHWFGR